ncbi:HIRA-interacting protein 3 [Chelonoidis abingdonii]|uniref:HIRA-interacting protein 3 n=1 Tax=Chelonoidis abingdonii TaxID=106734 RepID=UPI003F49A9D4
MAQAETTGMARQRDADFTRGLFPEQPTSVAQHWSSWGLGGGGFLCNRIGLSQQLDDSSSEEGSPSPKSTWDTPQAWTQKRPHSSSDSSGGPEDTARKKQRLDQGSEASSDGEDSGIDSRKPKEDAGKSRHTGAHEDEGDSGAEETPDRGGASRESDSEWTARSEGPKQPPRRRKEGAEAQDQLEKKRVREAEQRGDCGEQKGKANGGITAQPEEESGSESPVEEEECKWQKRTGRTGPRKIKQRSDSEEEGDSKKKGRMKARGKEVGSGTEVDEMCQSRKGAGKKGRRKAGRWSDSEEEENKEKITKAQREEESGSEEEEGRRRKPGTKKAELERKKRRTKAQSEEESGSELEEEEEGRSRKPAGKTGTKKVERRSDSEAEEVGSRKKRRTKAQSEEESGSEEEEGASRKETGKKGRRKAERGSESEEEEGKVQARQRGSSETDEDSSSSSSAQDENSPNPGSRREKGKVMGGTQASGMAPLRGPAALPAPALGSGTQASGTAPLRGPAALPAPRLGSGTKASGTAPLGGPAALPAPGLGSGTQASGAGQQGAGPAEEHPAVRRLKALHPGLWGAGNYKKLLAGCRSVKQQVGVLRGSWRPLGCREPLSGAVPALRLRREEAAEVAALDVGTSSLGW